MTNIFVRDKKKYCLTIILNFSAKEYCVFVNSNQLITSLLLLRRNKNTVLDCTVLGVVTYMGVNSKGGDQW